MIGNHLVQKAYAEGGYIPPLPNQYACTFDGNNDIAWTSDAGVVGLPIDSGYTMAAAIYSSGPPVANEILLGFGNTTNLAQYSYIDAFAATNQFRVVQRFQGANNVHATAMIIPTNQWCVLVGSVWAVAGITWMESTLYNLETGAIANSASGALGAYGPGDNLDRFATGCLWWQGGQTNHFAGPIGFSALWARRLSLSEQAAVCQNYCDLDHFRPDHWWTYGDIPRWRGGNPHTYPAVHDMGYATAADLTMANMAANDLVFDRQAGG